MFGKILGGVNYLEADYIYSLKDSTATSESNWGYMNNYTGMTNQSICSNASELTSTVLSKFGSNFKADGTGTNSKNSGYPILSWE